MTVSIHLRVNGEEVSAAVARRTHLADLLREQLGLTGTHLGCEHGVCGACTIRLEGEIVRSCLVLAVQAEGLDVQTIEGVSDSGEAADLQAEFARRNALQCGYCTPGMIMAALGDKAGMEVVAEIRHPLGTTDFSTLLPRIQALKPDILCIINFGRDQQISMRQATDFGLKRSTKIITPILLYTARVAGGPQAFDGVIGGTSYYWGVEDKIASAKAFNDRYRKAYDSQVPSDYGALGYAGVRAMLEGIKKAGSTDVEKVIDTMSGMDYDFYKGRQQYRVCDHQSVQSVFIIESKTKDMANPYDVFRVLDTDPADEAVLKSCGEEGHKA